MEVKSSQKDEAKKLEYFSLVSKVYSKLGTTDKVLAEFVTELGRRCETIDEFNAELRKDGAAMPDYLVKALFTIIHLIPPPPPPKLQNDGSNVVKEKFKDLSIEDGKDRVIKLEMEVEAEEQRRKAAPPEEGKEEGDGMLYHEEGPAFLRGQARYSVDMSPVKIFKNPEGSMSRAAALNSALTKERRTVREQQQRTMLDSIPKDLNRPWEDPMPETRERHLAQELRGVGLSAYNMPEWKKEAYGKALTFGQKSKLSIQEQRQSLPIYKLKKELIQAVKEHQVLVMIGETGSGKTIQVTQCLAEVGYTTRGKIGCTQPCGVAAMSVAKMVVVDTSIHPGRPWAGFDSILKS